MDRRLLPCGLIALAAGLCALPGCRSYHARPLDLPSHREAWLSRSAAGEGVTEFAQRLAVEEPGAPFDPSDGVTMREGEIVALVFNPGLRVARLRAEGALASAREAGRWEDPEFGLDLERILRSVEDPWIVGATVGVTIPLSGRLKVEKSLAHAEHRAEVARLVGEEWATRVALRSAWLEWSAQTTQAALTREFLERLDEIVAIVTRLEQIGELSRTEARLFRIERATRASELRAIEARGTELELGLRAIMGLSPRAPLSLIPAAITADETRSDLPADARRQSLEERNPVLRGLRAEYDAAEEALRLEIREQYPDLVLGPGVKSEDGDPRAMLGVALPIPLWNRNRQGIAEAESNREIARAAFETGYERLAGELAAAEARLAAARSRRETFESEVVPLVEEQHSEGQRVAALGEVDPLLLLDTLTRLHDAKTTVLEARLGEALALVRIDELIGPPGPGAPPEGAAP